MKFQSSINTLQTLSSLDWIVFSLILIFVFLAVYLGNKFRNRKINPILDYIVMGRTLTLPMFIATLSSSFYGGIFGVNEITFNYGIFGFITQGVFWYIAYAVFAIFIVKKISAYKTITLPELTTGLFGNKAGKITALFSFMYVMPISYVLSLGIFINLIFGIGLVYSMLAGVVVVCLYSAGTGFRAVVFSDLVQASVMFSSIIIAAIFCIKTFNGFDILFTNLPKTHFDPTGGNTILHTLTWGFIAMVVLIDPSFYQRCFATKDAKTARRGVFISIALWIVFDICANLGALYARAVIPDANASTAFFTLALQILPVGLKGFFIAGILATIFSTLDSFLFISSNTLIYDMIRVRSKNFVKISFFSMFAIGLLCVGLTVLFNHSFKAIWMTMGSYYSACILIPVLLVYIKPNFIGDRIFTASALSAAFIMTLWNFTKVNLLIPGLDSFYVGLATSILVIGISKVVLFKNETI
ncbi:MAG: sodium:solute symporter family protein [Elusimicrobiaceae bacterium]|jgi:solute:Na+ symporter, SSS family|nr:sodium:solute symporter family protein [Elusimicrobiaceae bacterium]MBT3955000.1 sodium:solute symporter family protein [Elusimicrobiaceae bacterium]MBT4008108.1 sodium:solute symporter family protein [Elusimicrobiaceae bacterium]MBT4402696.1 sodium:solute symporter family protein [Elusimicrobiaceae bacterium]MBT4440020.1 sodium:solute symporter family protein [Elusimicrobiaceae bacterium]